LINPEHQSHEEEEEEEEENKNEIPLFLDLHSMEKHLKKKENIRH